jgi:class 3 adenylate cyclase
MASTVTVVTLFTDLVESTALSARVGPEASEVLRREHFAVLRAAVEDSEGQEVKSTGDGLMVVFSSASAALECAVAMQQGLERRNREAGEPLQVRVGVAIGDAELVEGDYHGQSVVEAARLCATAQGEEILVSEMLRSTAGGRGGHTFVSVGALPLKGLDEPVAACRLEWTPREGPGWSVPLPPRLRAGETLWFVGRSNERAALADELKQVSAGACRVVLVDGEAGIGKTSLVSRAALEASDTEAVVLYGRCDEDLGVPYQPWAEALGHLVEHAPQALLRAHAKARGGDLLPLVPGLAARLDEVPAARSSDRDTERLLLFAAVLDLLSRAAADMPVMVVFDDLHWADRPSLLLLRHLIAASTPLRLLVLGTFRAAEVSGEDPLAELLEALHREQGIGRRIALQGLDDLELLDLLQTAAGHELLAEDVALRDALAAETDGNPFFVGEILRHLAETGALTQSADGRWQARELASRGLPVSVREVIGRRVRRLGPVATRALSAASVIGRDFDVQLLSKVADTDEEELLDALDAASGAALVADVPGVGGWFSFVHALIQRTLYDELSSARRQLLHRRIAEVLEEMPGSRDDRVGELAFHWYEATQPVEIAKTLTYSIAAGDRAQQRLAPDEAVRWYRQALELVDRLEPTEQDHSRCEVLVRLGTAQRLAGMAEFRQTLLEAAHLAQRLGDTDQLVQAALANSRGYASHFGAFDHERVGVLRSALDSLGSSSPMVRARLLALYALETIYNSDYDTKALLDEATVLTEHGDDPEARWHVLHALFWAPQSDDRELQARQAEYLGLIPDVDPVQQWHTYAGCHRVAIVTGHLDEARGFFTKFDDLAQTVGDPFMRWSAAWSGACWALLDGDLARGERVATEALQIALDSAQPDPFIPYAAQVGAARVYEGREEEIVDQVAQAAAENPGLPAFRGFLAQILALANRLDEARALLDDFIRDADELKRDPFWATLVKGIAETAGLTKHQAAARMSIPSLAPLADLWDYNGGTITGPYVLALGIAHTVTGEYDQADIEFARAHDMTAQAHALYCAARTELEWATMLHARGAPKDREHAGALLASALDTALAHSFGGIERRVRALDAALAASTPTRPSSGPAS